MGKGMIACAALAALFPGMRAAGITLASVDHFAANAEGWQIGGAGAQPAFQAGAGFDSQPGFLLHVSDGDGANGKWLMWSDAADWQGDYVAAGVTGIRLWADNRAGSPLGLRIAFDGPGGWFVSDAQTITNSTGGEDWTELSFSLVASNFSHVGASGGSGSFNATMSAVTRFEILGGPDSFTYRSGPDIIDAGISTNTVAIDGITAVPEPSVLALLAAPLIVLRRRR